MVSEAEQNPVGPSGPPIDDIYAPPVKSKSFNNMASLAANPSKRIGRKRNSRQVSLEFPPSSMPTTPGKIVDKSVLYAKSMPTSPSGNPPRQDILLDSTHSSTTSLASQVPSNKMMNALGSRPPSTYYSRDFLTSLAPREGGYAVAAQLGTPAPIAGGTIPEESRRSITQDDLRGRPSSRAPMAKSAGMGRWSLDGGEVSD